MRPSDNPDSEPLTPWVTKHRAEVSRLLHHLSDVSVPSDHPAVLVASAPKSASTFLTHTLAQLLPGYRLVSFAREIVGHVSDHRLCPATLLAHRLGDYPCLGSHHVVANGETRDLITRHGLRTIVTTRSLLDCLVSLREHLERDALANKRLPDAVDSSCFQPWLPHHFLERNARAPVGEQFDLLIEAFAPWYFQYFVSWARLEDQAPFPLMRIAYEDLVGREVDVLEATLAFLQESQPRIEIQRIVGEVVDKGGPQMRNRGLAGRGGQQLSSAQIQRLRTIGDRFAPPDEIERLL